MDEKYYDLREELKEVKKDYDDTKHGIMFENNNKRTLISMLANKCKIVSFMI